MRPLFFYTAIVLMSAVLGCQIGCGADDSESAQQAYDEQYFAEIESETRQYLYENADWNVRWRESRAAHKRYIKLRKQYPNAALDAYTEYTNWMNYGHPLSADVAKLSVKMDLAGASSLPDMLQLMQWELQIAKDNNEGKEYIAELEKDVLFWTELKAELISEGEDPNAFVIEFEIAEALKTGDK